MRPYCSLIPWEFLSPDDAGAARQTATLRFYRLLKLGASFWQPPKTHRLRGDVPDGRE